MVNIDNIISKIDHNIDSSLSNLFDFLRIKSISTNPVYKKDCEEASQWVNNYLNKIGLTSKVYHTNGNPIVLGNLTHKNQEKPHILFYGHYDVQPPDPIEKWSSDPFEPVLKEFNGKQAIVARGSSDDKGQLMTFIEALRAYLEVQGDLPVSISVLLEGEEECGSSSMATFIETHSSLLKADCIFICDTGMWNPATPAITTSLRGLLSEEFDIIGPNRDLHSGEFGGTAWNPIRVLSNIIAGIHDDNGKITIKDFYNGVQELDQLTSSRWKSLELDAKDYLNNIGQTTSSGEADRSILEQLWSRPTFEVNGIYGGYTEEGTKTVIPSKATAKITCRLVGKQDPDKLIKNIHQYIESKLPVGVSVFFKGHEGASAIQADTSTDFFRSAENAIKKEWSVSPILTGGGGSIPIVESFKRKLGIDSILVGFALDDDCIHSPNEKYNLESFHKGIRTWVRIINNIKK
jgi:acetylornithine deacetylase/succinyl-diaminopimelate desuccinylase-like protein